MAFVDELLQRAIDEHREGRLAEAVKLYERILETDPGHFYALHFMARIAYRVGNHSAAAALAQHALAVNPQNSETHFLLGQALLQLGKLDGAEHHFQQAAVIKPSDPDAPRELGNCFQAAKRFEDAVRAYRKAVELNPRHAGTWYSLGCAHNSLLAYADAAECFREALTIHPDWFEAMHNLGQALFQLGQVDEAIDLFGQAAQGASPQLPLQSMAVVAPGCAKFDNQAVLEIRRKWAASQYSERSAPRPNRNGEKLRIGYLSSFFQRPNWMKPVWGLINRHNRRRFELHLFSDSSVAAMKSCYEYWPEDKIYDIGKCSNEAAANLIVQCGLDLLVDLNGYSAPDRLAVLALRPAPVIAGWFNMYATSGMTCYDYLIGDEIVVPPEEEAYYCEKIVRVPGSYLTFEVTYPVPDVALTVRPGITFGCLASQYKISEEVVAAWSRILHGAEGSTLFLKNSTLGTRDVREYVRGLFQSQGISSQRIRLEGPADHFEFLKAYDEIDIALDTFPYNGGTTTTEAIWQGVPVLTFRGDRWASRTSASILLAAGLCSFVRNGVDDYVSHAIELANSTNTKATLAGLRRNMRARLLDSAVCDTQSFARNMERIYKRMLEPET
jgi:protein O-GlcNAc transferase